MLQFSKIGIILDIKLDLVFTLERSHFKISVLIFIFGNNK